MRILIVGAGIAGLTLAAFLKDSNIDFQIIDKQHNWDSQGFSIGLWNNGRNILAKLGLADKFDKQGNHINFYRVCDGKGKLIRSYNLKNFYSEYGTAYTHIDRTSLHRWLRDLINPSKVRLGMTIDSILENDTGVEVVFSDGEKAAFDFVIGADGIHSKIRNLYFTENCERFDNWRVWYAWVDNKFKQNATVTEYVEPSEFVGIFDVGKKALAVLISPADHKAWDSVHNRITRLKKIFKDETILNDFLTNLKDKDLVPTDLSCVRLKKFTKGRVVLVGDAAHGFEPHAGIGASMAMEDGYVLAAVLMKISESYSFKRAFERYERVRKERVKIARSLTNKMRAWAFIKSKWIRKGVNIIIPLIPESFFTNRYHKLLKEEI